MNVTHNEAQNEAHMTPGELLIDEGEHTLDRVATHGMRLNIASGTAVRFEPGQQRTVELVDLSGDRQVFGFRGLVNGAIDQGVADKGHK